jgi:hypothetical protein
MSPTSRKLLLALLVLVLVSTAAVVAWYAASRPRLTDTEARALISTTLVQEVPEQFLVTGTLDYVTRVERSRQRQFVALPGMVEVPLGTTRVSARVPGRVHYGLDVRAIGVDGLRLRGDTVEVRLPPLQVFAVEADLENAEIRTDEGWGPLLSPRGYLEERAALQAVRPRLRSRAEQHLSRSGEPERNAARALALMLRPAFTAAGYPDVVFTFVAGEGRALTPPSPIGESTVGGS